MKSLKPRKAQSPENFINNGASSLGLVELEAFPKSVPRLKRKLTRLKQDGHSDLYIQGHRLLDYAQAALQGRAHPFHPRAMYCAVFALNYLLKGYDAIPDHVPDIGLADDLIILNHVVRQYSEVLTAFETHPSPGD